MQLQCRDSGILKTAVTWGTANRSFFESLAIKPFKDSARLVINRDTGAVILTRDFGGILSRPSRRSPVGEAKSKFYRQAGSDEVVVGRFVEAHGRMDVVLHVLCN